ncbi:MAG: hypothetical protein IKE41_01645 [Clostridia bacterium]|nr:hypothetical protein [Clostridia bacterium]MBR2734730.1 hypothetical protein [Clostridia bacterium]
MCDLTAHTSKELPKELNDACLGNVVGGVDVVDISAALICPAVLSSFGCMIASCVYFSKVAPAKKNGEIVNKHKYLSKAKQCGVAAAALLGAGLLCTVAAAAGGEVKKKS